MNYSIEIAQAAAAIQGQEEVESKDMAMQIYSDVYKSYHGIRPRWEYSTLDAMCSHEIGEYTTAFAEREERFEREDRAREAAYKAEVARKIDEALNPPHIPNSAMALALQAAGL